MARHAGRACRLVLGVLAIVALMPGSAGAQGTARSLDLDPSIRASGMGGVSGAVFWGGDVDPWGDPALLAFGHGLRYAWGTTRLVPGLAPDVHFRTHRASYADYGVGVDYGRYTLNYGASSGTDPYGNPIDASDSFERVRLFGAAASVSGLIEGVSRLSGADAPAWASYVDVAAGMNWKSVDVSLAPGFASIESGNPYDWGVMVRVSPLPAAIDRAVSFDLAYAHAVLNANDVIFGFPATGETAPPSRIFRDGGSVRVSLSPSPALLHSLGWLGSPTRPAISLGVGFDTEHIQAGSDPAGYDVDRWGLEGDVLGLLALRVGHIDNPTDDLQDFSYGVGVGLPVRDVGGARFDFASVPQPSGLDRQNRYGVSVWLDPLALARTMQDR